jgi:sec-independent protein translocase protein TatB
MFDFDLSKMILVGMVALVVVGPKELPAVLRTFARTLAKLGRVQTSVRTAVGALMADSGLDSINRELEGLGETTRANIALDPATAMRGSLPPSESSSAPAEPEDEAPQFVSPEMQAYLAPPPKDPTLAKVEAGSRCDLAASGNRPAELRQRVIDVDDLVEPRPEEIVLPAVPPLLGPHRITLRQANGGTESRQNLPINLQEIKSNAATLSQMQILHDPR